MKTLTETLAEFSAHFPASIGGAAIEAADAHRTAHWWKAPADVREYNGGSYEGLCLYLSHQGYDPEYMRRLAAKVIKHWWKH